MDVVLTILTVSFFLYVIFFDRNNKMLIWLLDLLLLICKGLAIIGGTIIIYLVYHNLLK
jgi:hypothetical protein